MVPELKENERIDDLERNGYRIIQNRSRFCFGMDAVLLSGFAWEGEGCIISNKMRIADLGTGTGIIPLLLHGRMGTTDEHREFIYGIEIQPEMAEMAQRSVMLNGLSDEIKIMCADLRVCADMLGRDSFDIVTSNPPYMKSGSGLINPDDSRALSRHEINCTFDDVAHQASLLLKKGGRFYLVHRPERLTELFGTMQKHHLEPKRMKMVHSFIDSQAAMVLIEARKGGGAYLKVEKPLIIYKEKGVYTDEIRQIYGY